MSTIIRRRDADRKQEAADLSPVHIQIYLPDIHLFIYFRAYIENSCILQPGKMSTDN